MSRSFDPYPGRSSYQLLNLMSACTAVRIAARKFGRVAVNTSIAVGIFVSMTRARREAVRLKLELDKAVTQSLWSTASDLLDVIAALTVDRELLKQTEIGLSVGRARKLKSPNAQAVATKAKTLIKRWKSSIATATDTEATSLPSSQCRTDGERLSIRLKLTPQSHPQPQSHPTAQRFSTTASAPVSGKLNAPASAGLRASSCNDGSNGLRNTVRMKLTKVLAVHAAEFFGSNSAGGSESSNGVDVEGG